MDIYFRPEKNCRFGIVGMRPTDELTVFNGPGFEFPLLHHIITNQTAEIRDM